MDTFRKIRVTRATPHGTVTDEHQLLATRKDPNDLDQDLPVEPAIVLRVSDGGDRLVEYQVAEVIAISLD